MNTFEVNKKFLDNILNFITLSLVGEVTLTLDRIFDNIKVDCKDILTTTGKHSELSKKVGFNYNGFIIIIKTHDNN